MIGKVAVFGLLLLGSGIDARPQFSDLDLISVGGAAQPVEMTHRPEYTYSYQVANEEEQTYIAHEENRDGDDVQGEYSYVDPRGALITVRYSAGLDGYTEQRDEQENFITIRRSGSTGPIAPVAPVRPVVTRPASQPTGSDLVARIIAQLTPFIRDTVSSTLSSSSQQTTQVVSVPVQTVQTVTSSGANNVQSRFGAGGVSNIRVDTPVYQFAAEL